MFEISKLIPTHNKLRNIDTFNYFKSIFRNPEYEGPEYCWIRDDILSIVKTEDDKFYLWNGHHQICAAYDSGLRYIPDGFYKITERTYEQVMSINFDAEYVTPFNMINECRISDFKSYKDEVIRLLKYLRGFEKNVLEPYIFTNPQRYKEPRAINSIKEIVDAIRVS
jgi:hypothetical protein